MRGDGPEPEDKIAAAYMYHIMIYFLAAVGSYYVAAAVPFYIYIYIYI